MEAIQATGMGELDKVLNVLDRTATNIESIAIEAAKCRRADTVIERGTKDFNGVAVAAAGSGYGYIVDTVIERGTKDFDTIAMMAAVGGATISSTP